MFEIGIDSETSPYSVYKGKGIGFPRNESCVVSNEWQVAPEWMTVLCCALVLRETKPSGIFPRMAKTSHDSATSGKF